LLAQAAILGGGKVSLTNIDTISTRGWAGNHEEMNIEFRMILELMFDLGSDFNSLSLV
jgi:hypothetical protein